MTSRKVTAILLSMILFFSLVVVFEPIYSKAASKTSFEALDFDYDRENVYSKYIKEYSEAIKPDEEVEISASDFIFCSNPEKVVSLKEFDGKADVVQFEEDVQWVEYSFFVPVAGLYNIEYAIRGNEKIKNDMEFSIEINGKTPFNEAMAIQSFRGWKNKDAGFKTIVDENYNITAEFEQDRGNDLRPEQEKSLKWRTEWVVDSSGLIKEPFYFYFNEGLNTLKIITVGEPFYISDLKLSQYHSPETYKEVKKEYEQKGYQVVSRQIKVQGEAATEFSHSSLYPIYVRNNSQMEPYHTSKIRNNAIGGANWGGARKWIEWDIEVPESGLYQVAIKFEQNEYVGMFATRSLYVDGKVPFAELDNIKFSYDTEWQILKTESEDGEPYYIYLDEGKHTLRMVVNLGEMAQIVERLTTTVYKLNNIYSSVVMLASTTPDQYRDYYYDRNIPTLKEDLSWIKNELFDIKEEIIAITGTGSSQTSTLQTFIVLLEDLIKDSDGFSTKLNTFKDNISSLSQWIIDNKSQPIKIDYFVLGGDDMKLDNPEAGFFKSLWAGTKTFFSSFVEDYDVIGSVQSEGRKVKVWISTGRDQINIINSMIQDEFTPNTGINVQLELVQGALIESTLAGKGPDVALMISSDQPVNYAIRGALVDLSQFEAMDLNGDGIKEVSGFSDVFKRYNPQTFEAFAFQMNEDKDEEAENIGKAWVCPVCGIENLEGTCENCEYKKYYAYYAIPETQTYNMMFYRKDILAQLGLGVPETWDDFFALLPVIRRNNLEVGVPAATMYQILLYQYGGSYYSEDRHKSGLSTQEAKDAFVRVTDCFIKYDFPIAFDFYTRFRSGQMPISIQPYTQYNLINSAAPEIQGLWDMAKIPGTIKEDGTVDHSQNVTSVGCIMFDKTKDKDAAWAFIEWYTRDEMQTRYGEELESIMGAAGRYAAASDAAFENLAWTRQQRDLLKEQTEYLVGIPEVPGSYFTARTITLAFNDAYVEMENPYKALSERTEDLDEEIARKYEEFGLY